MSDRIESFRILLEEMCYEYGVEVPHGFVGNETVEVYRDAEGWHVGGEQVQHLTDDDWAPKYQEHIDAFRKIGF